MQMILHHIPMTMRYESLRTYENVYDYKFVQTLSDPTEHGFHAFLSEWDSNRKRLLRKS